ncbi:unnamed protein product [Rotaria sp. Silwood1]|nr:unnamed protein product [Rotaria sp. Silwood1]
MATTILSPYDILEEKKTANDYSLRLAYRRKILEYKGDRLRSPRTRKITAESFRLICRAYETVSDYDKRDTYLKSDKWTSNIPISKYTIQQLAAEPELFQELKSSLQQATLKEINSKDSNTRQTPLYCAARVGNLEAVKYLTEQGAESDIAQRTGSSALHAGSFFGHAEIVRCLLECGANYTIENSSNNTAEKEAFDDDVKNTFTDLKMTPFVQMAAHQLDWLKTNLANTKYHIDKQYYALRQTLLHCASKKGYLDCVSWLIEERSANLDIVDVNLNSALHLAAYGGHDSVVEYLLNRGANPLLLNRWCTTAEDEGSFRGDKIIKLFESMRTKDMFKMAADGIDWWFKYYFEKRSPDAVNQDGTSLLYIACRYGRTSVVEWLLVKNANPNVKLATESGSTPLHSAVYHGHIAVVDLLLSHGADIHIENNFHTLAFDDAQNDDMRQHLEKYRANLKDKKFIDVHLYSDGAKAGNAPLAELKLSYNAKYTDLVEAMPKSLKDQYPCFSIARRPLNFDDDKTTILSAVYCARCGSSKFIELPICLTAHERKRYGNAGHALRPNLPANNANKLLEKFKCSKITMKITPSNQSQSFSDTNLTFNFPSNCADKDVVINVEYIMSPDIGTTNLPGCICLFQAFYGARNRLTAMPTVVLNNQPNSILYNLAPLSFYWFTYRTRNTRLISIGETLHAFIRHFDIIPSQLTLPPDLFLHSTNGKLLYDRDIPVPCRCLKIRDHNKTVFPHIAYHGTDIKVIASILMDGLVMASTVVSSGYRVCPPPNHISRQVELFGIKDFANGIFVTPSIHYCSDPAYAVTFTHNDERLIVVLECAVKNTFGRFPSTVPTYTAHEGDNLKEIEWRLTNTADIEILSVLFIPVIKSKEEEAKLRAKKLADRPK